MPKRGDNASKIGKCAHTKRLLPDARQTKHNDASRAFERQVDADRFGFACSVSDLQTKMLPDKLYAEPLQSPEGGGGKRTLTAEIRTVLDDCL